jgi:hypothetical protein
MEFLEVGGIDKLKWLADLGGVYSMKSAYEVIPNGGIHRFTMLSKIVNQLVDLEQS